MSLTALSNNRNKLQLSTLYECDERDRAVNVAASVRVDGAEAAMVEYTHETAFRGYTRDKQLSCTGSLSATVGLNQPFRYRGYVYDAETGWYYLQSRYYDPAICRFISSDVYLSTGQGVSGHNAYAYCLNNPVGLFDDNGEKPRIVGVGVQISITVGGVTTGIEVVVYWDPIVCNGDNVVVKIYAYAGVNLNLMNIDVNGISTVISSFVQEQPITSDTLTDIRSVILNNYSVSVSAFMIIGNDKFTSPKDYSGTFRTVTAGIHKGQAYYSWSDTCKVIGVGVNFVSNGFS